MCSWRAFPFPFIRISAEVDIIKGFLAWRSNIEREEDFEVWSVQYPLCVDWKRRQSR